MQSTSALAGARSWANLAQFGKDRPRIARRLGFRGGKTPSESRRHHLFRYEIDGDAFERLLHGRVAAGEHADADFKLRRIEVPGGRTARGANIDGKRLRGTADGGLPGIRLPAGYASHFAGTVGRLQVPADTNEQKTALELLRIMPLEGTVVTGDAAFTQLDLSEAIVTGQGHYLWMVKDNQPALRETVEEAFSPAQLTARREWEAGLRTVRTADCRHGRKEIREVTATYRLPRTPKWPHAKQLVRIVRTRTVDGKTTTEIGDAITSLTRAEASAMDLAKIVRDHWRIENALHHVRDVTFGEDACKIGGSASIAWSILRNVALHVHSIAGLKNRAEAQRRFTAKAHEAVHPVMRRRPKSKKKNF